MSAPVQLAGARSSGLGRVGTWHGQFAPQRVRVPDTALQVLQVAEQILKTYEGLLGSTCKELPLDSQLGVFITDLRKQLATSPVPGEVLR